MLTLKELGLLIACFFPLPRLSNQNTHYENKKCLIYSLNFYTSARAPSHSTSLLTWGNNTDVISKMIGSIQVLQTISTILF